MQISRFGWAAVAASLAIIAGIGVASAGDAHVLFTADTQGHVGPCESCPGEKGLGSLARRQTMLTQLRQREPGLLLLDAGDALFGSESLPSGGKVIAAAYDALGYDVVNISYRDFRLGKPETLAALKGARFVPVSANLLDAETGRPLFQPYVIKQAGGMKLAVIGATEWPAALAFLPELGRQLAGVKIQPPADALAAVVPKARAAAGGHAVLLYYGSAAGAAPILKAFGGQLDVILVGGAQPGELPAAGTTPLVATSSHGRQVADVTLTPGAAPRVTQWAVVAGFAPDPAMKKLVESYPTGNAPLTVTAAPVPARSGPLAATTARPIDHIELGKTEPLNAVGRNRAVELNVKSVALLDKLGDASAPEGTRLLVLDVEFRNLQPPQKVDGQIVPAQYQVPKLADNLYGVADDSRVLRRAGIDAGGLLPFEGFTLEKQNDTIGGTIAYEVPRDAVPHDVKLRFYDFAHGNIVIPVLSGPFDAAKPVVPPQKNEVVDAAIYGVQKLPRLGDREAPPGRTFLQIDLRARSTMVTRVEASAVDFHAAPGAKLDVGTVADWKESRKYMQVVADGEHAYWPVASEGLPEEPRFLPDLMTGGRVSFLVPADARVLELRCDFPNASLPNGGVIRPAGLTLPIEGARPASPPADPPALAAVTDEVFDVAIVGSRAADQFGQKKAAGGRRFLVIDVRVKNIGKQQEFFQPKEQLRYADASGGTSEWDEATLDGVYPPAEQMYIPAGERRAFQIAYSIGAGETRPRLAYAAVTEGASKVLTLPALSAPAAPVASAAGTRNAPASESTAAHPPAPPRMKPTKPKAIAVARSSPPPPPSAAAADPAPAADSGPAPRPHGPARGIEGVGLTAEQVNAAIDRGGKALWESCKTQDAEDRVPFGQREQDVLCALALVHADAHKKIPECDAALRAFLTRVDPAHVEGRQTYVDGLLCMLIEAYGDPEFAPKLRSAARWLVEAQGSDGTWTYSANLPEDLFKQAAPTGVLQVSGGLPPGARAEEWKRLTPWPKEPLGGDNSCTQYALLGLQSAAAAGIRMPADLWSRALAEQRKRQGAKSGGWDYHDTGENGGYGSMTAAGICAVAIGSYQTGNKSFASDPAVVHGLGWMDKNFAVDRHPEGGGDGKEWLYYWLYSVERVGRMLDADFIGIHEWYPEGAAWLVHGQQANGLWAGLYGEEKDDPRLPSSFALLFLTRATPPLKPIERHGPGMLKTAAVAPDNRFYVILDASGSMLDNMEGRMKFDIARDSVRSMIDALPPNSDVALRVYGHRKSALDPDCDEDTELKIPMGKLDKRAFNAALDTLRPRGKTPMALSIEDAIHDLGDVSADKPVTLLLLTDGGEDTRRPRGNPIKACADLAKVKNVRFHIVGFDINEPDWSQQLQEMAQVSGGRYWPAARGADLVRSVRDAVLGIPEQFTVLDANGHALKAAQFGESVPLEEGKYVLRTTYAGRPFEQPFYVSPGETTAVTFDASQVPASAPAPTPVPTAAAPEPTPPNLANWPKFCTHCGAPLKPGQKFCTKCGQPVVVK